MKRVAASLVMVLAFFLPAQASTVALTASASGAANPPTLNQSTFQNGDFFVQRCCGDPIINNATEEYVSWDMNLSGQFSGTVVSINSATIQLQFRTGGDTPRDDELVMSGNSLGGIVAPYGFTRTFGNYDRSFDLASLFGESLLIDILNGNPSLRFRTSNDNYTYGAQLSISAELAPAPAPIPLPAGGVLLLTGLAIASMLTRQRKVVG